MGYVREATRWVIPCTCGYPGCDRRINLQVRPGEIQLGGARMLLGRAFHRERDFRSFLAVLRASGLPPGTLARLEEATVSAWPPASA